MWAALPDGPAAAIAPDGARYEARLCESAYLDVFDCAGRDIAEPREWLVNSIAPNEMAEKPAPALQPNDATQTTYTIALLSDYRRGGTSRSGGKPALQLGVDARLPDRWNFGARSSSIAKHGNIELALYGAKSIEVGDTDFSLGATALTFPRDPSADYVFVQASASRSIGPVDATGSVIYWPPQAHLDGEDGLYVVARARTPVGTLVGAPLTLGASIGRMRGHFADAHSRSDWSVSLAGRFNGLDIAITYVDNDLGDKRGDPEAVFSITRTF